MHAVSPNVRLPTNRREERVVNKGRRSADLSDEERCPNSARVVLERHAPHTGSRHSAAPGFTVSEKDGQSRDRANPDGAIAAPAGFESGALANISAERPRLQCTTAAPIPSQRGG